MVSDFGLVIVLRAVASWTREAVRPAGCGDADSGGA